MHVLIVSRSLPLHGLGGMEAVAWDLCRSLARKGLRVTVLTTAAPALPPQSVIEGITIVALDVPSGRYSPEWWRASRDAFDAYADCDIVLSVSIAGVAIAQDKGIRARSRAKVVFQCHGTADTDFRSKMRTGKAIEIAKAIHMLPAFVKDFRYRAFDAIVSIGPSVTASLKRPPIKWAVGRVSVATISNGIDDAHFRFDPVSRSRERKRLALNPETPVVVSASRLHVQKGLAEGLAGFARALETIPDLRYLIIGDGPDRARLQGLSRTLGVADSVQFAGAISREQLPAMLSAADIFLFSSIRREGLALGPLEAAACGLPCVLSDHLAIPHLDTLLVDPRTPEFLARGLVAAVADRPEERVSRLPKVYSLAQATSEYIALFEELIGQAA